MSTLAVGLVTFDSRSFVHWEARLLTGAAGECQVVARYSYGDGKGPPASTHLTAEHLRCVWLIDAPLLQPFAASLPGWLQVLEAPIVIVSAHPQVMSQLSRLRAPMLVCHPHTLATTLPLPTLLLLAAGGCLPDGPLYLGSNALSRGRPGAGDLPGAAFYYERPTTQSRRRIGILREQPARYELPGAQVGAYWLTQRPPCA